MKKAGTRSTGGKVSLLEIETLLKKRAVSGETKNQLRGVRTKLTKLLSGQEISLSELPEKLPLMDVQWGKKGESLSLMILVPWVEGASLGAFVLNYFRLHLIEGLEVIPSGFEHVEFHFSDREEMPLFFGHFTLGFVDDELLQQAREGFPAFLEGLKKNMPRVGRDLCSQRGIHGELLKVVRKFPGERERLLREEQRLEVLAPKGFFGARPDRGVVRLICTLAWLRRLLTEGDTIQDYHKRVAFRLLPVDLAFSFGEKRTMGLCIGVCHLGEYQLFHEGCIFQAVSRHVPDVRVVRGSYQVFGGMHESLRLIYVELEKDEGKPFLLRERQQLMRGLEQSLEASIEEVVPAVLMMRNDEEIMKNIMILRNEIDSMDDVPQVVISLEGQSTTHLTFIVTMVWIAEKSNFALQEVFEGLEEPWGFTHDRQKVLSQDGDEFTKEAHVFRIHLRKSSAMLRTDASVNLHRARELVVNFLEEKLGKVRDYTGGMIVLQNTLFKTFLEQYEGNLEKYPNLLEDFFYALGPVDRVITLSFETLQPLFDYTLELVEGVELGRGNYVAKKEEVGRYLYVVVQLREWQADPFDRKVKADETFRGNLLDTRVRSKSLTFLGYLFCSDNLEERAAFLHHVQRGLESCIQEEQKQQILRLQVDVFPKSLDPRLTLHLQTSQILKLLFDGLMRIDAKGKPKCAVAKTFTLSQDQKTYTFHLRESYWNNGDPVTAHHFAYAWKKVLSPHFETPFAYLFFAIKNARKVKLGLLPLDEVGIRVENDLCLVVELEHEVPHFLYYLALNLFYPINNRVEKLHPDWSYRTLHEFVCNGPFMVAHSSLEKHLQLVGNKKYWDQNHVRLSRVDVSVVSLTAALRNYQTGKVDWLGNPFTNWENNFEVCEGDQKSAVQSRQNWMIVNTKRYLMSNKKMRQAIFFALDRTSLVKLLPVHATPTGHVFPPQYSSLDCECIQGEPEKARYLYACALEELNVSKEEKVRLVLAHCSETFSMRKRFLQEMKNQLDEVLGIDLEIEIKPWDLTCETIAKGLCDLCFVSWNYFVNTPFYFLDVFQSPEHKVMYHWDDLEFLQALGEARQEKDLKKQRKKLRKVESILYDQCPTIPLYFETEHYLKNPRLKGFILDEELGLFDFKEAFFKSPSNPPHKMIKWI